MTKPSRKLKATSEPPPETGSGPDWRAALALAGVTLTLGAAAALLQPWDPAAPGCEGRTPPDETAHVLYLRELLDTWRLPVLRSGGGNYEAHQPPLYYLSALPAAALGRALDGPAPPLGGGLPPEVVVGRLWAVLLAAGGTVASYLLGCAVFPGPRWLPVAVAAFSALLPGHLVNVAAITNDGLAEALCTLALWLCVSLVRAPALAPGRYALLGALVGLALLAKTSCLFLLVVAPAAVALAGRAQALPWRQVGVRLSLCLGTALILWAPWIAHNLAHYPGDPLVTRTFLEVFGADRATPETFLVGGMSMAGYLRLVALWTYLSFWGVFGQAAVFMPGTYYLLGTLLTVGALVGALRGLGRWGKAAAVSKCVWSLLALSVILVALQFLRFNFEFFQAQARYLFLAIGPLGCVAAAGIDQLGRRFGGERGGAWALAASGVLLLLMAAWALVAVAARGPVGAPAWLL